MCFVRQGSRCVVRVLICNARMSERAGSELATFEFARHYRNSGHDVAIFTLLPAAFAEIASAKFGIPVFDLSNRRELQDFAPDLIHVHHWPTIVALEALGIRAPWFIGFLGFVPPLENPPPMVGSATVPWWTLNDVIEGHVNSITGWSSNEHVVVGNWFDDEEIPRCDELGDIRLGRLLVVSNHFPSERWEQLRRVCEERNITIDRVGLPQGSVEVNADFLRRYDGVITLGRTALMAMAMGKPTLLLDHYGADGWVLPENLPMLARHNFSGRWQRLDPTDDQLHEWISQPPSSDQLLAVSQWAFENARLSSAFRKISQLALSASSEPPSTVFGTGILAVGELLNELTIKKNHEIAVLVSATKVMANKVQGSSRRTIPRMLDRFRSRLFVERQ